MADDTSEGVFRSAPRRAFLLRAAGTLGALAGASALPAGSVRWAATPWSCGLVAPGQACGDWQLDDICNSYPPYAWPVAPPPRHAFPAAPAESVGADHHWLP